MWTHRIIRQFSSASGGGALKLNDSFQVTRRITQKMVDQFVTLIGDNNPIHVQSGHQSDQHRVPGALLNGLVSGLIGSHFPGAGCLVVGQEYAFPNKCHIEREIDFNLQLVQNRKIMKIAYECQQEGTVVLTGVAKIVMNRSGGGNKQ